jgi:replicative DNA helicase
MKSDHTTTSQPGMPWSREAEMGLLSCLLQNPTELLPSAQTKIPADAFYDVGHGILYSRLLAMQNANKPIDLPTVINALQDADELDKVCGASAVSDLFIYVPVATHWEYYVEIVLAKHRLRLVEATAVRIIERARTFGQHESDQDSRIVLQEAEAKMFDLLQAVSGETMAGLQTSRQTIMQWADHMDLTIANRGKILGLTTGIHEIDNALHGLDDSQGEILVIAGRPGQGKTAAGISIESHFIDEGWPGLVISAEMSAIQWTTRLVLGGARIDTAKGITGYFSKGETETMNVRAAKISKATRLVNSDSYITSADLRTQAQIAKRKHGIRWMIVDHLTLIKPVTESGQEQERIGIKEVMEAVQWIKKELKVVVILLVQMNRESDRNVGKAPVMADLAGSAAIEQYADHIMFLYRPSYYVPWHRLQETHKEAWINEIEPRRQRNPDRWATTTPYDDEQGGFARLDYEQDAIIFVRKNRRGPTPEVHVRFEPEYTWYSTRLPCLNSTHPLDQAMGSYSIAKAQSNSTATNAPIKPRATRRPAASGIDDVFTNDTED